MKKRVQIFIEGGGKGKSRKELRHGFSKFIGEFSTHNGRPNKPQITMCGPRNKAFDLFINEIKFEPEKIILLLVDSEGPVTSTPVIHLDTRDGWDFTGIDHEKVHLMVQTMEAWFMADKEAIKKHYGNKLNENALPNRLNVEEIPKDDLKPALELAGRPTPKLGYREIRDGSGILYYLDREKVKTTTHGKLFFEKLEEIFSAM